MPLFAPLLNTLTIQDKDLQTRRLDLQEPFAWAQREFVAEVERQYRANKPVRVIVLKARQLGISTATEALLFWWCFIHHGTNGLVIAHEVDASQHLYEMSRMYWDTFPFRDLYTHRYLTQRRLTWADTGSSLRIATAKNVQSGRGRTLHAVHCSEVAFWEDASTVMTGLAQTIPYRPKTILVLESTANGVGDWFYDQWQTAKAGGSDLVPLFFPWWRHPEYTASWVGIDPHLDRLDDEEDFLRRMGCDDDHLAWRRWAIPNLSQGDEDIFRQEYPATDDEAFLATGSNVFNVDRLKRCYEPEKGLRGRIVRTGTGVEFRQDPTGPLRMFRQPSTSTEWGTYFVGGDPSHGVREDRGCIQVINRRTYEQVAVWHGMCHPYDFAEELLRLGEFYNMAEITTEVEGPGYATIGALMEKNYPYIWQHRWADKIPGKLATTYGWSTSYKRKEWAINFLLMLVLDRDLLIHDETTFVQMRNYVSLDRGGYGPGDIGGYDDAVMAMAITAICSSTDGPLAAYSGSHQGEPAVPAEPEWATWG